MRVRKRYYSEGSGEDMTTEQLIELGVNSRDGQIEQLEATVRGLVRVVAALIDRSGLSEKEILRVTNADWTVESDG